MCACTCVCVIACSLLAARDSQNIRVEKFRCLEHGFRNLVQAQLHEQTRYSKCLHARMEAGVEFGVETMWKFYGANVLFFTAHQASKFSTENPHQIPHWFPHTMFCWFPTITHDTPKPKSKDFFRAAPSDFPHTFHSANLRARMVLLTSVWVVLTLVRIMPQ